VGKRLWCDFPELEGESGFAEQAAILQTISELDVRLVIPGHGAPFSDVQGALQRARQRLDYLSADPQRNARNALKVLLAFILLDTQKLHLDQALLQFNSSRLMRSAARQLAMPAQELLQQIAAELVRAGVARLEDGLLLNNR
jgi:glyoxylase-like metal-dependent hydrolase (beta-lactamase superfamily II)